MRMLPVLRAGVSTCWLACLLSLAAVPALAQSDSPLAGIARLQGEARTKALVEGARKEGELMIYHSSPVEDLRPLFEAFTKKHGIKVNNWRSSSENVLQRVIRETRANKFDVDFIENNSPEVEALRREKMLQRIDSPYLADMQPYTVPAHREWVTSTMDVFVHAYNTEKVKREELPKTYQDLLDPRWKGRLGIEAEDQVWFGTLLQDVGEERGLKLWRDIVSTNGVSVRKGHTLLTNLVASGEIPLALTVYNYKPPQLKEKGGKIDWFVMSPAVAQLRGIAVTAKAPHPHAAMLFLDFMLSDAQQMLAARHFVPASAKVPSPLGNTPIKVIDAGQAIDKYDQWTKLYEDTITKRAGSK
jgi:iron(III) transport system substrate-binding protein